MHLLLALLAEEAQALFALHLGGLVQRLDVRRVRVVVPLAGADLVELVVAPEEDVAAPVCVVDGEGAGARRALGHGDRGDVVHDGGGVGGADGHVRELDGDDARGGLVVLVEAGEGCQLGGRWLGMCPAAVAELAGEAEAEGPDVGLHAGGIAGCCDGLGGFDGEEGGVAAGEDVGHRGLLGGASVEALGRKERGCVDEGGLRVEVEA